MFLDIDELNSNLRFLPGFSFFFFHFIIVSFQNSQGHGPPPALLTLKTAEVLPQFDGTIRWHTYQAASGVDS